MTEHPMPTPEQFYYTWRKSGIAKLTVKEVAYAWTLHHQSATAMFNKLVEQGKARIEKTPNGKDNVYVLI